MKIGEKVNQFRNAKLISMRELAKLSDLSAEYIGRIERGEITNVGIEKLQAIANALNISIHTLIEDTISKTGDQHDNTVPQT